MLKVLTTRILAVFVSFSVSLLIFSSLQPWVEVYVPGGTVGKYVVYFFVAVGLSLVFSKVIAAFSPPQISHEAVAKASVLGAESICKIDRFDCLRQVRSTAFQTQFLARIRGSIATYLLTVPSGLPEAATNHGLTALKHELKVLRHLGALPGVPTPTRLGKMADGTPYYLSRPANLTPLFELQDALPAQHKLSIIGSLFAILREVHKRHVVHSLINSHTVCLDEFGQIRLCDWQFSGRIGQTFSKSAEDRNLQGIAPEQLKAGATISPQTDLYAVACIAYELVTNKTWNEYGSMASKAIASIAAGSDWQSRKGQIAQSILAHCPDLGTAIAELLQKILGACLSPNPSNRPDSASAVMREFASIPEYVGLTTNYETLIFNMQLQTQMSASRISRSRGSASSAGR